MTSSSPDGSSDLCPLGCPGDPLIGCDHCFRPDGEPCGCRACVTVVSPPSAPSAAAATAAPDPVCSRCGRTLVRGAFQSACLRCEPLMFERCRICGARRVDCSC